MSQRSPTPATALAAPPRAARRSLEAIFAERAGELVQAVVNRAEAGDRFAMRLARTHALPFGPSPELGAARLAASIARTRATVATLLAEGGFGSTRELHRPLSRGRPARPAAAVIAFAAAKTRRRATAARRGAARQPGALVNNNESTSAASGEHTEETL